MSPRAVRARAERTARIVLVAIGTKGDLFPLLALGRELVRRGHDCDLLSNEGYDGLARKHGLSFRAVTGPQTNNLVSGRENLDQHVFPSYEPTFEYFAQLAAREERPVVVNLDECSASNLMCERYGLPLCRVVLAPSRFKSVHRPSWPMSEKVRGPMAHTYRRYRLPQLYEQAERAPFLLGRINPYRAKLGLRLIDRFSQINAPVRRRVGFFPSWFAQPQPDWPEGVVLVGFPLPASEGELPAGLEAFLAREGPPLVFTPGTGVAQVEPFFAEAQRCCERLERPGVFLSPRIESSVAASPHIYRAPFVDLQLLARRSALLVHHGGIGTTARALEAGIPQVICSQAYDQPDNGERVAELGVGTFFAPGRHDLERMTSDIARLLGDPEVERRLARLKDDIRRCDAIGAAADQVELDVMRQ